MIQGLNRFLRWVPKWAVYLVYLLPVPFLLYQAQSGALGVEPVKTLEHELGEIALQLLIIGLCVTPLRRFFGINALRLRRVFGVLAFIYVALHLSVWVFLDMQLFVAQMITDIFKRPYITIGMVGFLAMVPLAVTSNNAAIRKLGAMRWNKLHRLAYPAVILGVVHFVMVQRVWEPESLIYLAIAIILVALRFRVIFPKSRKATDPVSR